MYFLTFFVFSTLTCVAGQASRQLVQGSSASLTNCCLQHEVSYCYKCVCFHQIGCVMCTGQVCWNLDAAGYSVKPGCLVTTAAYVKWLPTLSGAMYVCGLFGVGEQCSVALVVGLLTVEFRHVPIKVNASLKCIKHTIPTVTASDPLAAFREPLAIMGSLVTQVPKLLWALLSGGATFMVLIFVLLILEDRYALAVSLLVAITPAYASVDVSFMIMPELFTAYPKPCFPNSSFNSFNTTEPFQSGTWVSSGKLPIPIYCDHVKLNTSQSAVCVWGGFVDHVKNPGYLRKKVVGSSLCFIYNQTWSTSMWRSQWPDATCAFDQRDWGCGACCKDCWEWGLRFKTFQECGIGPSVTSDFYGPGAVLGHDTFNQYDCKSNLSVTIGGRKHTLCAKLPLKYLTRIPGEGVRRCVTAPSSFLWGLIPSVHPKICYWPVLNNSAFNFGAADSLIHVSGLKQYAEIYLWKPYFFMMDHIFIIVVLMKLSRANFVPVIVIGLWLQLTTGCPIHDDELIFNAEGESFDVLELTVSFLEFFWRLTMQILTFVLDHHLGTLNLVFLLWSYSKGLRSVICLDILLILLTTPVMGAVNPQVFVGGLVAHMTQQSPSDSVVFSILIFFLCMAAPRGQAIIGLLIKVAMRLWVAIAITGFKFYLGNRSVFGACSICFSFEVDVSSSSGLIAFFLVYLILLFVSLLPTVIPIKLELYRAWLRLFYRFYHFVDFSMVGAAKPRRTPMFIWWVICLALPDAATCILTYIAAFLVTIDFVDTVILMHVGPPASLRPLISLLEKTSTIGDKPGFCKIVQFCERHGIYLFNHMGQLSKEVVSMAREVNATLEPLMLTKHELEIVDDCERAYSCGGNIWGKPVIARCGDSVIIGNCETLEQLPPGYVFTAPVLALQSKKGFFKVLLTSLLGKDTEPASGEIMLLGTATTRSMGTCVDGSMFTSLHSSSGRALATPLGAAPPRFTCPDLDLACYQVPQGAKCLTQCTCGLKSAWVLGADGLLRHGELRTDRVVLDTQASLSDMKGSSGGPVLCDLGHVLGITVAAHHVQGRVNSMAYVKPWNVRPSDAKVVSKPAELPPVAEKLSVHSLIAETGSGKSTAFPMEYVKQGRKVLVLNPSVATTLAMQEYMESAYNIRPNIYAADHTRMSGSKLTYSTYGRFCASRGKFLRGVDVVFCDECHSVDGTSVVGMGMVLDHAEESGVKVIIFATATPPSCAVSNHPMITEEELGNEGVGVKFYGKILNSANYLSGRHLIFCHSKAECTRVAQEMRRYVGIPVITYWRGEDRSVLDIEGPVVIVATDALSTGWSGNVDTVTDCSVMIEESVTVTANPTISLAIRCIQTDAVTKMQRRGRCGRGRAGKYYFAEPGGVPNGLVPAATTWAAAEAAVVWFGLPKSKFKRYLDLFHHCPYTCMLSMLPDIPAEFMYAYSDYATHPEVTKMLKRGYSWPLLTGVQRDLCKRHGGCPPDKEDPRWEGIVGTGPCPLLLNWGVMPELGVCEVPEVRTAVAAIGIPQSTACVSSVLVVAAAVAAAASVCEATGCLVVVGGLLVSNAPTKDPPAIHDPLQAKCQELAEACSHDWLMAFYQQSSDYARSIGCGLSKIFQNGQLAPNWCELLFKDVHTSMALAAASIGIASSSRSPMLAQLSAFVSGALMKTSAESTALLGLFGGMLATMFSSPVTGVHVALQFVAGWAVAKALNLTTILSLVFSYEACSNGCLLVLKLLTGKASLSDCQSLISMLTSPGAALCGVVLGLVMYFTFSNQNTTRWTNRMLAMVVKGNAIPDDFFLADDLFDKLIAVIQRCTLSHWISEAGKVYTQPSETLTAGGAISSLIEAIVDICRWCFERLRRTARGMLRLPKVPFMHCTPGWTGRWVGTGVVNTWCHCGCRVTVEVTDGNVTKKTYSSYLCTCFLKRSIPIHPGGTTDGPMPLIPGEGIFTYRLGLCDYVALETTKDHFIIHATSDGALTMACIRSRLKTTPVAVNDVGVSFIYDGTAVDFQFMSGNIIKVDGQNQTLPAKIPRAIFTGGGPPPPAEFTYTFTPIEFCHPAKAGAGSPVARAEHVLSADIKPDTSVPKDAPYLGAAGEPSPVAPLASAESLSDIPPLEGEPNDPLRDEMVYEEIPLDTAVKKLSSVLVPHVGSPPWPEHLELGLGTRFGVLHHEALLKGWTLMMSNAKTGAVCNGKTVIDDSSEWVYKLDITHHSESDSTSAYVWSGAKIKTAPAPPRQPTNPVGGYLTGDVSRTYMTDDPTDRLNALPERVEAVEDEHYVNAVNIVRSRLKGCKFKGFTYEEAAAKLRSTGAAAHNTKLTVAEVKQGTPDARAKVQECLESIAVRNVDANPFCVAVKHEVFALKGKKKPARLICYPSLEFRVCEKMILGDVSLVAKRVLGESYGFQYTPQERTELLVKKWKSMKNPVAIEVDAKSFDSTITPKDIDLETDLYASVYDRPELVRALGEFYRGGPIINTAGEALGVRNCRASGVLTTSSSNTITCYIKVLAACGKAGIKHPWFLIHGDDTIILHEGEVDVEALQKALHSYGYISEPSLHSNLDSVKTCSSFVGECVTVGRARKYFTSCDMTNGLARMIFDGPHRNPISIALGYILMYPWHPITRYILLPFVLVGLQWTSPYDKIACEVRGNYFVLCLADLPKILVKMHGKECLRVIRDSRKTLEETNRTLQFLKMKGLKYHKKRALNLKVALLRRGGEWALLARQLLWDPLTPPLDIEAASFDVHEVFSNPYQGLVYDTQDMRATPWYVHLWWFTPIAVLAGIAVGGFFSR
nr:polyprotein [Pegivirus sp.]